MKVRLWNSNKNRMGPYEIATEEELEKFWKYGGKKMVNEKIPKEYIVKIKCGDVEKEFVTYSGLLELAHKRDLRKIYTEITQVPAKEN
ncbi:MAG: hypothetical protein QME47_08245, partial [Candidatus Thermoplasmatota archaeon]|nr:hypothetical protein [Candidatus Thermoplasmatota archaeon]